MNIPVFIYKNCIRNLIIALCRDWSLFNNTTLQYQANELWKQITCSKSEVYNLCRVFKKQNKLIIVKKKFLRCSDDSALVWFPPKERKDDNGELKCKNSNKKLDVLCRAPPSGNLRKYSYQQTRNSNGTLSFKSIFLVLKRYESHKVI